MFAPSSSGSLEVSGARLSRLRFVVDLFFRLTWLAC